MIATQTPEVVAELTRLMHEIERESKVDGSPATLLADIRSMERDLLALERDVLERRESEGLKGDAC